MRSAIALVIAVMFSGCATHATLTVTSKPEGAYITEKGTGTQFGIAPIALHYDSIVIQKSVDSRGCYLVNGLEARWVSGVTTSVNQVQLCGTNYGSYTIQLSRNMELPGFEKDMNFAIKLKSMRAQQAQARASKVAADAALFNAIQSAMPKTQPPTYQIQKPNSFNCTSRKVGNTVYTDCY